MNQKEITTKLKKSLKNRPWEYEIRKTSKTINLTSNSKNDLEASNHIFLKISHIKSIKDKGGKNIDPLFIKTSHGEFQIYKNGIKYKPPKK